MELLRENDARIVVVYFLMKKLIFSMTPVVILEIIMIITIYDARNAKK